MTCYNKEVRYHLEKERLKYNKKRQFTPEQKVQIVLEILREENTIGEIGSREISRTRLQNRKKEFIENASHIFTTTYAYIR